MRMNAGYFYGQDIDGAWEDHPFFVSSCGHYQLIRQQSFLTERHEGRQDWQLLYVAGGKVHFYLPEGEQVAREGEAFLYPPGQPQKYGYTLPEKPDVYWLHFSGAQAEQVMAKTRLPRSYVFHPGFSSDCVMLLDSIIRELQQCGLHSLELASIHAQALLFHLARGLNKKNLPQAAVNPEIGRVLEWMHLHPEETLPMAAYAKRCSMSLSTFIRRFRAYTGLPPQQYMIRQRMSHAKELMASSSLTIGDIALIVGYDNPLYFSRLFKKETGMSPRAYRKTLSEE